MAYNPTLGRWMHSKIRWRSELQRDEVRMLCRLAGTCARSRLLAIPSPPLTAVCQRFP